MKRFTDHTWDNTVFGAGITERSVDRGWTVLHDLAVEAYEARGEDTGLDFDAFRNLVEAAEYGLPIIIRHRTGACQTERTYIVTQFMSYRPGTTSNLYVRSWGFSFPLALSDIVEVRVPEQVFV